MAKQKLTIPHRQKIADRIATEAFKPLLASIQDRERALLEKVYVAIWGVRSRDEVNKIWKMLPDHLLKWTRDFGTRYVRSGPDNAHIAVRLRFEDERPFPLHIDTVPVSEVLANGLKEASNERTRHALNESDLRSTLFKQLGQMKTVEDVIEAWPEAESFVKEIVGAAPAVTVTKPLAVLLGQFLPALPAPERELEAA
jgi:ribosomal protein L11